MTDVNGIWAEVIAAAAEKTRGVEPGEMTIKMFSDESGMVPDVARRHLDELVKKGVLTKRKGPPPSSGGTYCWIYRPVEHG